MRDLHVRASSASHNPYVPVRMVNFSSLSLCIPTLTVTAPGFLNVDLAVRTPDPLF